MKETCSEPFYTHIYNFDPVENVCDQELREIFYMPNLSVAHVRMAPGNASLLHKHAKMSEVYFIVEGDGTLRNGNESLMVMEGACVNIPPGNAHLLKNGGDRYLEHLVFCNPPFDATDIELLEDNDNTLRYVRHNGTNNSVHSQDGAIVYELLSKEERDKLGFGLALRYLLPRNQAKPHYHAVTDEVYFVLSGTGLALVGEYEFEIEKGSIVHVPKGNEHALRNIDMHRKLEVLCLSTPAYSDDDFLLVE
jgi:mannose-6-phosphate isomerase-like protein (cupin superfamily)